MKIADLELKEDQKRILAIVAKPKKLAQIAAKLNKTSTSGTHQKVSILEAMGHITKIKTIHGKTLYVLHENIKL